MTVTTFKLMLFAFTPFGDFGLLTIDQLRYFIHVPIVGEWPHNEPLMKPGRYRMIETTLPNEGKLIALTSDVCDCVIELRPALKDPPAIPAVYVGSALCGDDYHWRVRSGAEAFQQIRTIMNGSDRAYILSTQPVW